MKKSKLDKLKDKIDWQETLIKSLQGRFSEMETELRQLKYGLQIKKEKNETNKTTGAGQNRRT